ncbi:hypothetical protein [Ekhidna sp.]|uniref:hypothetical protein n=1 Tax=Ekhidna sp. TaxID=2608089 RepID=UPI003B50062D
MKKLLTLFLVSILTMHCYAQDEDIVKIVDNLTKKWDKQAVALSKYSGIKYYCTSEQYRENTIGLLDKIHHYDTVLYTIVSEKYENKKDKEAHATLKEILTVETNYTTPNFKTFLQEECEKFIALGQDYDASDDSKYYKEIEKIEKELSKYISHITKRIDLIDEHIHHLKLD